MEDRKAREGISQWQYCYLFSLQDESEVIKRALSTTQCLHLHVPQFLFSDLQQWFDEMRLAECDIQKDSVGLENAVDLPL